MKRRSRSTSSVASALCAVLLAGVASADVEEEGKLVSADAAPGDQLGHAVAVDGNTAVLGAPGDGDFGLFSGGAYVFVRSGGAWSQQAKLLPSDGTMADRFGWAVAVAGDTAVVTALFGDGLVPVSGSAYVFVRSGVTWTEQARLFAADGATSDWFGRAVAIDGDTVVVGSPQDDDAGGNAGSAYVFQRTGSTWSQAAKLVAADAAIGDNFGQDVDLDTGTIAVGAPFDDDSGSKSGSAYVFVGAGASWSQQAKLVASDGSSSDSFGYSVAVSADALVAGAYLADGFSGANGAGYVYARVGTSWSEQEKLLASDGAAGDELGWAVEIDGTALALGARRHDGGGSDAGAAYLFAFDGTDWAEQNKLTGSDTVAGDEFGFALALDGPTLIAGAYQAGAGAGYAFLDAGLRGVPGSLSVAGGGVHTLTVAAGSALAGDVYLLAGSVSGTTPGFAHGGWTVPLNPDGYTAFTLFNPSTPPLSGFAGLLDASGSGSGTLTLGAGGDPALVGLTVHHAAAVVDAGTFAVGLVTNAAPLALVP